MSIETTETSNGSTQKHKTSNRNNMKTLTNIIEKLLAVSLSVLAGVLLGYGVFTVAVNLF